MKVTTNRTRHQSPTMQTAIESFVKIESSHQQKSLVSLELLSENFG